MATLLCMMRVHHHSFYIFSKVVKSAEAHNVSNGDEKHKSIPPEIAVAKIPLGWGGR